AAAPLSRGPHLGPPVPRPRPRAAPLREQARPDRPVRARCRRRAPDRAGAGARARRRGPARTRVARRAHAADRATAARGDLARAPRGLRRAVGPAEAPAQPAAPLQRARPEAGVRSRAFAALAASFALFACGREPTSLGIGARVTADRSEARVGDPIGITVEVETPAGYAIQQPAAPSSAEFASDGVE